MAAEARMLGAWIFINNPNRSTSEDLNLQVGGTVKLNTEALRLLGNQLLTIKIEVLDEDAISDDLLLTNESFQLGVPRYRLPLLHYRRHCAPPDAERLRAVL